MANRDQRARVAQETVAISYAGTYKSPSGRSVSILDAVRMAIESSELIAPVNIRSLHARAEKVMSGRAFETTFAVANETTLAAARRLVDRFGPERVAALNFASAKNPGGGFLGGSQAQEESLARATALYACLEKHTPYYEANRRSASLLYTDHMIVSPRVPVFRGEEEALLDEPWELTIVTSPAPNAGAIAKNEPDALGEVEPTFRGRVEQVLAAAASVDQTALVLGAWGCGVFGNGPAFVAKLFGEFLLPGGRFAGKFEHVAFAVLDRRGDTIAPFVELFQRC
jgi:uncharacterized protein (TIGR02452 family)